MSLFTNFQDLAKSVKLALDRKADKSEIPDVPVQDVEVNGVSVVSQGTASVTIPTAGQIASGSTGYATGGDVYTAIGNIPQIPVGTNAGDILVWSGSAWVAKAPSRLPNGFTEVEWIQSTGDQYIDTGVTSGPSIRIVADVTFEDFIEGRQQSMLFGRSDSGANGMLFGKDERGFVSMVSDNYSWNIYGGGDNNRHTWDISSGSQKIDGVQMSTSTFSNSSTRNLYLCARFVYGSGIVTGAKEFVNGKIYNVKIYRGSGLIRDFIPCYNSGGEIGLFDVIGYKFYTNAGTGTFTKGADV